MKAVLLRCAAGLVILDPARTEFVVCVVAAFAAISVHVNNARSSHLAHMVDKVLHIVALVAAGRLVAILLPTLFLCRLGDNLRLGVFVILFAIARFGRIGLGFAGVIDHGRLLSMGWPENACRRAGVPQAAAASTLFSITRMKTSGSRAPGTSIRPPRMNAGTPVMFWSAQ